MSNKFAKKALTTLLILQSFTTYAASTLDINNLLKNCVTLTLSPPTNTDNLLITKAKIELNQTISECGCKSAVAHYSSSVNRGDSRQVLQEGLIGIKNSEEKLFVLSSEPLLSKDSEIIFSLSCAAPL